MTEEIKVLTALKCRLWIRTAILWLSKNQLHTPGNITHTLWCQACTPPSLNRHTHTHTGVAVRQQWWVFAQGAICPTSFYWIQSWMAASDLCMFITYWFDLVNIQDEKVTADSFTLFELFPLWHSRFLWQLTPLMAMHTLPNSFMSFMITCIVSLVYFIRFFCLFYLFAAFHVNFSVAH